MIPEVKQVNFLDILVVLLYLLMLTGVGIYLTRFNKTVDDFFKGGGKIPWWISALSTFVAGFSAFMFVGAAGYTYLHGMSAVVLFTSAAWGYGLGYVIYAVRWRRARLSSPMEFLTRRFSQGTTYYYTFLSIVPAIMGLGLMIYTLCKFTAAALGIVGFAIHLGPVTLTGLEMSMIITGLVMLIYTSAGGLWAVVITDSLQFFIILVISFLIFPLAYIALGNSWDLSAGFSRLIAEAPEGYLGLTEVWAKPWFYFAYMIATFIGYNAAWHIGQRYYSVPTERDSRKMALLCAGLSLVLPFLWIAPTLAARVLFPDIAAMWPGDPHPEESAFVTLALTLLPNGLIGLTLSAILAAAMTSIDTQLNYLASILIRDVYVRVRTSAEGAPPHEAEQLRASRITAIILGVLATATALFFQRWKSVFDVALNYYSWFGPSMLTPVMLGFLYRKTPSWSAIASSSAGLAVVLVVNVFMSFGDAQYEANIIAGVGCSSLVFFLTALWPERSAAAVERIKAFFADQETPAADEALRWSGNALSSYRIVGVLTAGIGTVVLLLGLVPSSIPVHILTVVLGGGTAFLGWLMTWYFRKQSRVLGRK